MALLETLRQRAALRGGSAQVDCGELGLVTVEALSPADCARYDGDSRGLVYAACRELQLAGEILRSEGGLFRPDEITAFLTDREADTAAQTVRELSGMSEIRLSSVQTLGDGLSEIRPDPVQGAGGPPRSGGQASAAFGEIRPFSVQADSPSGGTDGQVSRELPPSGPVLAPAGDADRKALEIGDLSAEWPQIVVPQSGEAVAGAGAAPRRGRLLHETESAFGGRGKGLLHETTSESVGRSRRLLHETTSESSAERGAALHEIESESAWLLHEIESELRQAVHEIKSELTRELHEIRSELAEDAARRLAEGIRQAGQVG